MPAFAERLTTSLAGFGYKAIRSENSKFGVPKSVKVDVSLLVMIGQL